MYKIFVPSIMAHCVQKRNVYNPLENVRNQNNKIPTTSGYAQVPKPSTINVVLYILYNYSLLLFVITFW